MGYKTEAFDLWQYLCADFYEPLIRCRVDFDGFIDENTLKAAVTESLKTIPMIGLCFDEAKHRPRWTDKGFDGGSIVRVVKAEDGGVEQTIQRCLSAGIDFATEPQLKLLIVRAPDGDTLCAIISHIVCDGAGFKQYLHLLSKLYTQLLQGNPPIAPEPSPRGLKPVFADVSPREKLKILSTTYAAYKSSNKTAQLGVDLKSGAPVTALERRTIPADDFSALKAFAKSTNATVNDVLMALFAESFCEHTNTPQIRFPSTMDLRKFIPSDRKYGITNYSSNCICEITVKPGDPLSAAVTQVSEQMDAHKSDKNILKSVMLWSLAAHAPWFLLKRNLSKFITHPLISFTNLGIIDPAAINFGGLKINAAYLTASIKPRPYFQITASTFNDTCTLACNIQGSEADKQFASNLLNSICQKTAALK